MPPPASGQWPQWRGLRRDGTVYAPARNGHWPDRAILLWERNIGEGYSGPVSSADFVWVHTRQEEKEVVHCLRLATGDLVWSQSYDAPFRQDDAARSHGRGPYATPAVSGGRLFTLGIAGVLSAWDCETGKLLWRRESGKEFDPAFPGFGAAASPLVWGDLCFVHLGGHDRENIENPSPGAIVALALADGREKWRWTGDAPGMGASPMICEVGGQPQLVFKTKQTIVSFDPPTGRKLWQIPYNVPMYNTIVTPVFLGDRLLTSDYDVGLMAWRIHSDGDSWQVQPLWKHRDASLFTSSPVLAGGLLVGLSHFRKGELFGLDPVSGSVLWRGEPRSGEHASLISWGNEVLMFRADGLLVVGEVLRDSFRILKRYRLGNLGTWAHPAVLGNRIIIKDGSRLAVYQMDAR